MPVITEASRLLDRILASTPEFHCRETEIKDWDRSQSLLSAEAKRNLLQDTRTCYSISPQFAHYLLSTVKAGMRTLETGAGTSTLVFAMGGANHVAVTPDDREAKEITAYAAKLGIDLSHVVFALEPSDRYLPSATLPSLDLVLLDGKHAFPWPIVDWFYTAEALEKGGLLMLDDIQLPPVAILADFLKVDSRWAFEGCPGGRTAVFRKLSSSVHDVAWHMQNWTINEQLNSNTLWRRVSRIHSALRRRYREYFQGLSRSPYS